jgi:hypothetical protein
MSYLFPLGDKLNLGVVQVGANIDVDANSIISIAQDISANANVTFNSITANTATISSLTISGNITAGNVNTTGNVYSNGKQTITSVTPSANVGISLSNVVTSGPAASFQINNTGVLSLIAGTGITLSANTGNVTVSASGIANVNTRGTAVSTTLTATDDYVGATASGITLTLPLGTTGQSYILKNEVGSGLVTVAATGPNTIDGSATKNMTANASITVVFRAGAWRII